MSKQLTRPEITFLKRTKRLREVDMDLAIGALTVVAFVFGAFAVISGAWIGVEGDVSRGIVSALLGGIGLWTAAYGSTNFRDE